MKGLYIFCECGIGVVNTDERVIENKKKSNIFIKEFEDEHGSHGRIDITLEGGEYMNDLLNFIKGKRTYVSVAIGVVVVGAFQQGLIDERMFNTLSMLFAFLGIGFLRASKK